VIEGSPPKMSEQPKPIRDPRSKPVTKTIQRNLSNFSYDKEIWSRIIQDLEVRERKGIETYGDTLHSFNGRDALWDLYEELLDALQYAQQTRMEGLPNSVVIYSSVENLVLMVTHELVERIKNERANEVRESFAKLPVREAQDKTFRETRELTWPPDGGNSVQDSFDGGANTRGAQPSEAGNVQRND